MDVSWTSPRVVSWASSRECVSWCGRRAVDVFLEVISLHLSRSLACSLVVPSPSLARSRSLVPSRSLARSFPPLRSLARSFRPPCSLALACSLIVLSPSLALARSFGLARSLARSIPPLRSLARSSFPPPRSRALARSLVSFFFFVLSITYKPLPTRPPPPPPSAPPPPFHHHHTDTHSHTHSQTHSHAHSHTHRNTHEITATNEKKKKKLRFPPHQTPKINICGRCPGLYPLIFVGRIPRLVNANLSKGEDLLAAWGGPYRACCLSLVSSIIGLPP